MVDEFGDAGEATVSLVSFPEGEDVAKDGLLCGDGQVLELRASKAGAGAIGAGDGVPAVGCTLAVAG